MSSSNPTSTIDILDASAFKTASANRPRRNSSGGFGRFWFTQREDVAGQPRLTRLSARAHVADKTNNKSLVLSAQFTIDGFSTESELHNSSRYAGILQADPENGYSGQVARLWTQQFVQPQAIPSINALIAHLTSEGWTLIDNPSNAEGSQRKTKDMWLMIPPSSDDVTTLGTICDLEISSERDGSRLDLNFDGDFTAPANEALEMIERAAAADEEDLRQVALGYLGRISGTRRTEDGTTLLSKNVSAGALRFGEAEFRFYGTAATGQPATSRAMNAWLESTEETEETEEAATTGSRFPRTAPDPDSPEFTGTVEPTA